MKQDTYDLVVVGAGAGGIGTALAAARLGVKTLLVEKDSEIGGTAVRAGVSSWEMSVSGTGISQDIYHRLTQLPGAVGIYSIGEHCLWPTPGAACFPGGQNVIDATKTYADTLRRYGSKGMRDDEVFVREYWHGVPTEPTIFPRVVGEMLSETGFCDIALDTEVREIISAGLRVNACILEQHGDNARRICASFWVDCTGDADFCARAGCAMMQGTEGQDVFGEPDAPLTSTDETNGVTLIYRVTRDRSRWLPQPTDLPPTCWWQSNYPYSGITEYPNGDWNINMLPTMEGRAFRSMPADDAYRECVRRVWAHWRWTQQAWPDFARYGISWIAPRIGVREGPRVRGEYVLTEHDLLAGLSRQAHEDIIAIADHAIDVHGNVHNSGCGEVTEPYGIPFRCLIPQGWENLLVACRGASFSHIGAASCRLTRTMMQLGQAAGTAVALATQQGCLPRDVPGSAIREQMMAHGVVFNYQTLLRK